MNVVFGKNVICPLKKLIRPADSQDLKDAIVANVDWVERFSELRGVRAYLGEDKYTFSRGKGEKVVKFFLTVEDKAKSKTKHLIYSSPKGGVLPQISFMENMIAHLCENYEMPILPQFRNFFDIFFHFVKNQSKR